MSDKCYTPVIDGYGNSYTSVLGKPIPNAHPRNCKHECPYPRTDSRYLTDDMEASLPNLIAKAEKVSGLKPTDAQDHHCVINSKKVTDHHAIIPIASVDKADLSELPNGEREVLKLIATRLLEAVSSPCIYAEAVLESECAGERFTAKGKSVIDAGWKGVAKISEKKKDDPDDTALGDTSSGITALYERLSRDDDNAGESNSITHQKQMLEDYAIKNGFTNLVHFTDDGWSGASFDRPAWNRLVEGVKSGQITAVIAKDDCEIIGLNQKNPVNSRV